MRVYLIYIFFIILFIGPLSIPLKGQSYSLNNYTGELNIKISDSYIRKLKKAIDELNEAEGIERQSIELINDIEGADTLGLRKKEHEKAIANLHKASKEYHKAHMEIYEIWVENVEEARSRMKSMQHYSSGLLKAKFYEKRAQKTIEKAANIREIVLVANKPGWLQYKMSEALELEKLAIRDKGRALNIMQDFPVEYDYRWENDVTMEEVEAALGDPAINRPPDELFTQLIGTTGTTQVKDTVNVKKVNNAVLFSVQIAAHTIPLTNEFIKTIYTGKLPVDEKIEDGWYKYSIGKYYNFEDANRLLQEVKIEKAFIVAYHKNMKLSIKKALELIRENQ